MEPHDDNTLARVASPVPAGRNDAKSYGITAGKAHEKFAISSGVQVSNWLRSYGFDQCLGPTVTSVFLD